MKKLTLFFVLIPLLYGNSLAQIINSEPYKWNPFQKSSLLVLHKASPGEIGHLLTFEKDYSVVAIPVLSRQNFLYSKTGPLVIVKLKSAEYELVDISRSNLDVSWIKSISVYKDSSAVRNYGLKAEKGVIVIQLAEDHGAKMITFSDGRIVRFLDRTYEDELEYDRKWVQ